MFQNYVSLQARNKENRPETYVFNNFYSFPPTDRSMTPICVKILSKDKNATTRFREFYLSASARLSYVEIVSINIFPEQICTYAFYSFLLLYVTYFYYVFSFYGNLLFFFMYFNTCGLLHIWASV